MKKMILTATIFSLFTVHASADILTNIKTQKCEVRLQLIADLDSPHAFTTSATLTDALLIDSGIGGKVGVVNESILELARSSRFLKSKKFTALSEKSISAVRDTVTDNDIAVEYKATSQSVYINAADVTDNGILYNLTVTQNDRMLAMGIMVCEK